MEIKFLSPKGFIKPEPEKFILSFDNSDAGECWITDKTFNNGEFDYKYILDFIKTDEAWIWGLFVVKSKKNHTRKNIKKVAETFCVTTKDVDYQLIYEEGLYAKFEDGYLFTDNDTDVLKNIERVKNIVAAKLQYINTMFGFYMDKPQNRIGKTGWDFIDGIVC